MNNFWIYANTLLLLTVLTGCGAGELTSSLSSDTNDDCVGAACDDNMSNALLDQLMQTESQATISGTLPTIGDNPTDVTSPIEIVTQDDLDPSELERINLLRGAIALGLDLGRNQFEERVGLFLQEMGLVDVYDVDLSSDSFAGLLDEAVDCPFLANYDNGFEASGFTCDYLVDQAVRDSYSELTLILSEEPLPEDIEEDEEAGFWYEQGAISGIEEQRVRVQFDLEQLQLCNQDPTPIESSYDKGLLIGRQLFADEFNVYLASQGFSPEYPQMQPIEVCNADLAFLDPALNDATALVEDTANENPLCAGYSAPTPEDSLYFEEAEIDYLQGVQDGVDQEYALAAVSVFQVIPCVVADPLIIDLDGDGIELTQIEDGVNFNLWGHGHVQAISWLNGDDGFLALDRNQNGQIDNGSELFGNTSRDFADGFEDLAQLDSNNDLLITADDALFAHLMVWQDSNTDGVSTANELMTISSLGIEMIPLTTTEVTLTSGGNSIPEVVYTVGTDSPMMIGDAFLRTAPYARMAYYAGQ
jgi:hypothetical protein